MNINYLKIRSENFQDAYIVLMNEEQLFDDDLLSIIPIHRMNTYNINSLLKMR